MSHYTSGWSSVFRRSSRAEAAQFHAERTDVLSSASLQPSFIRMGKVPEGCIFLTHQEHILVTEELIQVFGALQMYAAIAQPCGFLSCSTLQVSLRFK